MRKEVSPLVGVVLILVALATVQLLYWRGLVVEERLDMRGASRGEGSAFELGGPSGWWDVGVETVAGRGEAGHQDGPALEALFDGPAAVAAAPDGRLYVGDSRNHVIRVISPAGQASTVAGRAGAPGYADGIGGDARFSAPAGVALMPDGAVLVADTGNHRLRRVSAGGRVSTYAGAATPTDDLGRELGGYRDGPAAAAEFRYPVGLAVDGWGAVYIADAGNGCVRRISPDGQVTTLEVEGVTSLQTPTEVCLTSDGALWVADTNGHSVWTGPKVGPLMVWTGDVSGPGEGFAPSGIAAVEGARGEERLYVADSAGGCLWLIDGGGLELIAGEQNSGEAFGDGGGDVARFNRPAGLSRGPAGTFYVADFGNERIRRVTPPRATEERD